MTEDHNQKISDFSKQAEEDAMYAEANAALQSSHRGNFNVQASLRNADPDNQNDIYIGWQ
ncbi:MAG: hypothetical protein AUK48_00490 [Oscillatoriales cyanobacterium CG2_30_44_21]|nr:MAG: hypothetical protein AUK48_00490 [Oscillatoriales cyanobacterium CG2_30_44_21]